MNRLIYMAACGLMWLTSSAQTTFERSYTNFPGAVNPMGRSVIQTEDQGYVVCAPHTSENKNKFILLKISPSGDTVRTRQFDGYAGSVLPASDDGLVIAGDKDGQMMLMKTNAFFEEQWTTMTGQSSPYFHSLCQSSDSGFCFIGRKSGGYNMGNKLVITKTDKNGNSLWTKYFGEYFRDFDGRSIISIPDGGFVICGGYRPGPMTYSTIFLLKVNSQGDSVWMKTYTGSGEYSFGHMVMPNGDNGYMIAGYYDGPQELLLLNTNSMGEALWTRKYNCIYNSGVLSAVNVQAGGYMVAGTKASEVWKSKMCLIRVAQNGDTLWTREIGTMATEMAECIKQTGDQGYIVSGSLLYPPMQNTDIHLIKTDSLGSYFPVSVNEHKENQIRVFPNPATAAFTMEYDDPVDKLEIYDITGRSVGFSMSRSHEGPSYSITLGNHPRGIYLLKITSGKVVLVKRIMVEN